MSLYDINGNIISENDGTGILDLKDTDGILDAYTTYPMTDYATSQTTDPDVNSQLAFTFTNLVKGDILKWKRKWNGQDGTIVIDSVNVSAGITWTSYLYGTYMLTTDAETVVIKTNADELESAVVLHRTDENVKRPSFWDEFVPTINDEEDSAFKGLSSSKIFDLYGGSAKRLKKALNGKKVIFMGDSYTKGASSQFSALCEKYGSIADNRGIVSSSICGTTDGNKGFQPMWKRTENVCTEYAEANTTENVGAIVFMGGANDGFGKDSWLGSGTNDKDTSHIYGALHNIFKTFHNTFDCPIFVILQPYFPNGSAPSEDVTDETALLWGFESAEQALTFDTHEWCAYSMQKKQAVVKEMAEYYNCIITDCCFNWHSIFDATDLATYWSRDGHPTATGYQEIANDLEKTMLIYKWN